ncbi:unnamed protein product [Enterobius vermicularis]|uniref:Uncharacterized protein n=1 Tax=Enterobius vermicularis TaxID=51028 RepID=A0A0N4VQW1_ENTVE|nr:unnamed protein product [Enterobius vermicularis]
MEEEKGTALNLNTLLNGIKLIATISVDIVQLLSAIVSNDGDDDELCAYRYNASATAVPVLVPVPVPDPASDPSNSIIIRCSPVIHF